MHTIKPIDGNPDRAAKECGCVITEGRTFRKRRPRRRRGGSAFERLPVPWSCRRRGHLRESGDYEALLAKYGLCPENIAAKAKLAISKK